MLDKRFIVTELNFEEIEIALTEKIEEFILLKLGTLGTLASKQINVLVEYLEYMEEGSRCFKDELRCELWVTVTFNQYKYMHKPEYGEHLESIGAIFEYKGKKPFYINGEFVSRNVFEWMQGMPIQKNEVIYGIGKDKLGEMFDDLITTC